MTSSLVGSEMCIRDRHSEFHVNTSLANLDCFQDVDVVAGPMTPSEIWSCLLYTSDAADDM
eukprot:10341878-Prorocentrum_lima.AAC.1